MEPIPEYAYSWRPYANEEMIYKNVTCAQGNPSVFVIDPWNQRWILVDPAVPALLRLANGRRRFSEILRTLHADASVTPPAEGYAAIADQLRAAGLLFDRKLDHSASGLPVYNKSEIVGLHIEITNACNMTCTHCYVASGKRLPGEMNTAQIYKVIDELPPFSGRRIAISGGEPAVHKDCGDIVEHCAVTCGHDVDLYTNGKKFPRKLAERIKAVNARGLGKVRLQMSLEGATASLNDLVRGAGSFQAAIDSLRMFKEVGLSRAVVIFVCLTKHNIKQVDDIIRICEEYDVQMLVFSQWQKQGNASDRPWASLAPTVEQWVAVGEKLLRYDNPRLLVYGNFFGDLNNNEQGRLSLDSPLFPKQLYFYNSVPRVTPQGDIFADQLWVDPEWILGNVTEMSLEQSFNTPKFYEQLDKMRRRTDAIDECKQCEWRRLCEGGNAGHTYAEYGHMDAKDLFCESRKYWFERYVNHQLERSGVIAEPAAQ